MTYLYGDSTDSGLELNYIELLREFLDFAVQVMLSEHRIATGRLAADDAKRQATNEIDRLRALGASVGATLEKSKSKNPKSAADQSIVVIQRATEDTLRRAAESLKQSVAQNEQKLVAAKGRERAGNAKLIEPLLLNHQLPDSESYVNIELDAEGLSYAAEVHGSCKQGLSWRFAANIPEAHFYREAIKVSSIDPELTIELPEMSGFVRKSVKLKSYRLFPLFLTSVRHVGSDVIVQLRHTASTQDDTGVDIRLQANSPRVSITRLHKGEESPPFDASGDDASKLMELVESLSKKSTDLIEQRARLFEVRFDRQPLASCGEPTTLVTRLIQRIGPVVSKIAEKSLAESELVLKRVLDNGRREEIFASKADMLAKLSAVPAAARWVFAPLGLGDLGSEVGDHDPTNRVDGLALSERAPESPFDDDSIETRVPGEDLEEETGVQEVSEIIALAPDEDDDEPTELAAVAPSPPARARASQAPPAKAPPAPMRPLPPTARAKAGSTSPVSLHAPAAPAGDSIDVALAELEADS